MAELNDDEFLFDGINSKTMGLIVKHINKPIAPEISNTRQPIPAMYGDINQGNAYGAKTFTIDVQFLALENDDYNDTVHNLAAYLLRPYDQGGEYEMVFGDEPDVTYYGTFTQIPEATQIQETVNDSQFTLTFVCSDPQGYGDQQSVTVDAEPFDFTPLGTGYVYPVYTFVPTNDVYELGVALGGDDDAGYINVGYQIDASQATAVADNDPMLVKDPCNTLATWITQTATPTYLKGVVDTAGGVQSNTNSISIKETDGADKYKYGNVVKHDAGWFGQLLVHEALPTDVSDFDLTFRLHHIKKYSRSMSKTELYMLDKNGNAVGLVNIADASHGAMSTFTLKLGKGLTKVISDKIHFGPSKNGKNTTTAITVKHKKTTTKVVGKGKKSKKKTVVTYPTQVEHPTDYNNTDYFNNGFVQVNIRKVGLKLNITVAECDPKTGAIGKRVINNRQYTLTAEQDFSMNTVAWFGAMYPITEDKPDASSTSNPVKKYDHGFNSITGYRVKQVLKDVSTEPQIIAHAGSTIVVDSQDHSVTVLDAGGTTSLNKQISYGSTFPPVRGGITTPIAFSPSKLEGDVSISYRPAYL